MRHAAAIAGRAVHLLSSHYSLQRVPVQVATYHHDIKRMDDSVMASGQGGLQVCLCCCCVKQHGVLPRRLSLTVWMACTRVQIIGGDASMPDAAPSTGMRAFKVFLIQVRQLTLRQAATGGTQVQSAALVFCVGRCSSLQELCTCSLRGVLDQGVIQYTPKNTVRELSSK